jgi:hypothetical protein
MPVQTQLQQRRGTAASWTSTNPTLAAGEIGFESDTGKFKIGNGSTAWASLAYATNGAVVSPLTTKGDLFTYSTTNARLAVGANGESLVADSSTSTGLRYQGSIAGGKNFVINGAFDNWQRGTSFASPFPAYTADRYAATASAPGTAYTVSQQTSFLTSSRYALRLQRNSGQTGTAQLFLGMGFETTDVVKMQGKTMTWSFYAKAGSNYSPTSSALGVSFYSGTGIDQGPFVGHTGEVTLINVGQVITTTGTRYSYTFTVPTNATSMRWNINMVPTGTAGTNDFYEITNMQLEIGSVATEFSRSGGTIQGELAACQRYYEKSYAQGSFAGGVTTQNSVAWNAASTNSDRNYVYVPFKVTKRGAPTITVYSPVTGTSAKLYNAITSAGDKNASTNYIQDNSFAIYLGPTDGANAVGDLLLAHYVASAEL